MYGGSSKLGRGGAGRGSAGNRRLSYPPPPLRSSGQSSGRLSIGAGSGANRNPSGQAVTSSGAGEPEESFSLVPGKNPLAFAMIIRLTPDLVEEIRRVEAQDGIARIKFDANRNNPSENVIDVAGKTFRFTWSPEVGDLCDIYEERQNGEDGNGLLLESGSAWRKLNVQRILDESTTNHVKMRSEEAERKHKSRKAIVLDHGNPSMKRQIKSQIKALAAVEANPRMMHYKQKKEPALKKQKVESSQVVVGAPPKFTQKSGLTSGSSAKAGHSVSPILSPPEQSGLPASPFGTENVSKDDVNFQEVIPTQIISKENAVNSEKEISKRASSAVRETPGRKENFGSKPTDLRTMLITLLMENPKGMSLKALEKAIGDSSSNSIKIEPIIKRIATFQAPGRYVLRPEVELESLKKPWSESGSSPEDSNQQVLPPGANHNQTPGPASRFEQKIRNDSFEAEAPLYSKMQGELNASKEIDIKHHSPDMLGEKKGSDISEGQIESSSASGSDSESDSSDSGSDSGSHSRSRSPMRSGSASSSDTESDGSSNSKEGSDEDVDIMSDDDKEPKQKLQTSEIGASRSPLPWRTPEDGSEQGKVDRKQDYHELDAVEIEKEFSDNENETEIDVVSISVPNTQDEKPVEETNVLFTDCERRINYVEDLFGDEVNESTKYRKKSYLQSDEDFKPAKSRKAESGDAQMESPRDLFPNKGASQMTDMVSKGVSDDFSLRTGKLSSDFVQSDLRYSEQSTVSKVSNMAEREKTDKLPQSFGRGHKHYEKSWNVQESPPRQNGKAYRYSQDEFDSFNEKTTPVNSKEVGAGGKHIIPLDSLYRKHGDDKFKEMRQVSGSQIGSPPKDNNKSIMDRSAPVNGGCRTLRRELSELELGELREPLPEEPLAKNKFERNSSFKMSDKVSTSDIRNTDVSRGKPDAKETLVPGNPSPANISATVPSSIEGSNKKRTLEHRIRGDQADLGSQFNKLEDMNSKLRHNEDGASQVIGLEGFGESQRKVSLSALQQRDIKRGPTSEPFKERKRKTSTTIVGLADVAKDTNLMERNNNGRKRRDSSSDANSCSYSKYEKDEPVIRGPIKDFSQYEEYVQEYRDKYDSYCSLNKILEGYRNMFHKLKKDLESAKGRDMDRYYDVLNQLKESFHQCRPEHQRLTKIFCVLHEELKHLKLRIKDFAESYSKG